MLNNNVNARNIVLSDLCEILEEHAPSHIVLAKSLSENSALSKEDRSFVKQLTFGTVERCITLDGIINKYSSVKTNKQKPVIRNILRMAVFQIIFLNTPDSAACNEAVKLAKKRGFTGLSGFVNGILRKVVSERENIIESINAVDSTLSFRYSIPEWIADYYMAYLGKEKAKKSFEYFLKESTTQIRCNISKTTPDKLEEMLINEGVTVIRRKSSDLKELLPTELQDDTCIEKSMIISGFDRLDSLRSFKDGLFTVQDFSSVIAGETPADDEIRLIFEKLKKVNNSEGTDVDPKLNIIDMCAAPGGKTINLADRISHAGIKAEITACDISEQKLSLIRENVNRCGFKNIKTVVSDGTLQNKDFINRFDIVIADVPCSGLGVIARKPDIKYNATPESIDELVKIQRKILENAVSYLKTGGYMIFSTCTVGDKENEENLEHLISLGMKKIMSHRICAGEYQSDGFFYSVLKKC